MLTGPPPKFHGTWDILRHLPAARTGQNDDLLAALCEARAEDGERFTDADIINHMIFLMMAAHDTSTITTAAVAYFLAKNPEWQDRLRAESDRLGDDLPDIGDLERLTAMDLVIKELLKLVAPVPLVMRKTVTETSIDGYYIPSGRNFHRPALGPTTATTSHWSGEFRQPGWTRQGQAHALCAGSPGYQACTWCRNFLGGSSPWMWCTTSSCDSSW